MSKTTTKELPYTAPDWQVPALARGEVSRLTVPMEPQPEWEEEPAPSERDPAVWCGRYRVASWTIDGPEEVVDVCERRVPYPPGSLLYVQEEIRPSGEVFTYAADGAILRCVGNPTEYVEHFDGKDPVRDPSPIPADQMPKWAARLWLRVHESRPVRLGELTEREFANEGVPGPCAFVPDGPGPLASLKRRELWNGQHGARHPWEPGRWVWDVRVEPHQQST